MGKAIVASAFVILTACSTSTSAPSTDASSPGSPGSTTTASIASPSAPGPPIDIGALDGTIAFSAETNDIWSMRADGTHLRRLTSAPAMEFDPTQSPDGSRVAYRHQSGDDGTTEIYVMEANGSRQRNLTHNDVADWGPAWSPEGSWIAFNSAVGTEGFGFFGYAMSPDGSRVRTLTHHYVEYLAWSPDGSRIAFMAQEPGATGDNPDYNIFAMDADGGDVRRLTTAPGSDGWPAWSSDGSRIVFSSTRDDCSISDAPNCRTTGDIGPWHDAWIMNADGSNQHRLTAEFAQFFAWSPDGSAILVAGGDDMFLIRPDGSGLTTFPVDEVAHPLFPDWIA